MQIPIITGIYTDEGPDFRQSYPRNYMPVPMRQGISEGYLRPGEGIVLSDTGPGVDRGGINWNGAHYRVMGGKFCSLDSSGTVTEIASVPIGTTQAVLDYSFDYLSVAVGGNLYLYNGSALKQVADADLGTVVDQIWVDGYFMTTDGEFLVVSELSDPFSILPTKYGSSEVDPDPIKAIKKLNNEPHAINRYTIEVFDNVGGTGFPFQRIDGAQVSKGAVGTHACCVFMDSIGFVGGGRNEPVSVYMAAGGNSVRIATREIDKILDGYSDSVLENIKCESRMFDGHHLLYIHLPDQTLVYDGAATQLLGSPVWFTLGTGIEQTRYKAQNFVYCYEKWWCGDPMSSNVGYLSNELSSHWGNKIGWEFSAALIYNNSMSGIVHELELVSLTGRSELGADPVISTEYSVDGQTWSIPRFIKAGKQGERAKRLVWLGQGPVRQMRSQRFKGTSDAQLSFARLNARVEALNV